MEISLSAPIAEGRTAEIYEWGDGYVLKLYREWCPSHWVEQESKVAHAIYEAGIPAPAAGDIIDVNHRRGLVYERVTGVSMLQDINARPWMLLKHARTLAKLQIGINQLSISGLQSYEDGLMYAIRRAPHLSDGLREKVLNHLTTLTDDVKVCHGDFHPGNVLLTEKAAIVIDWMTASSGNPWADVARTIMLLTIGVKGARRQVSPLIRFLINLFRQTYLNHYLKIFPDKHNELKQWMPVIAAARLNEHIDPEREALIGMVQEGLME
jgi:tRNA A-37 threonylcarbamoyl transferase component Bud32